MKWVEALKIYNSNRGMWCVPKKGTDDYNDVMKIMKGENAVIKKPENNDKKPKYVLDYDNKLNTYIGFISDTNNTIKSRQDINTMRRMTKNKLKGSSKTDLKAQEWYAKRNPPPKPVSKPPNPLDNFVLGAGYKKKKSSGVALM